MPLPVGHALAGVALRQVSPGIFFRNKWRELLFLIFIANLPDIDFLPGLLLGRPNLYHHGLFHSLGAALATAVIGSSLFSLKKPHFRMRAVVIFLLFYSHLLLDFFTLDFVAPFGLPLFWPFSGRYFIAAEPFFINVSRSPAASDFFPSLFNNHNLQAALREIVILGGIALAALLWRRHRERKTGKGEFNGG
jgi:inner membrane protein